MYGYKRNRYSIPTSDGLATKITCYLPDPLEIHPLMIFSHGFKGFAEWGFIPYLCQTAAERGIIAIAPDYSRNGLLGTEPPQYDPDIFATNTISIMLAELHNIVDEHKRPDHPVGKYCDGRIYLGGHSLGGALSIIVAAEREDISKTFVWNTVSTLDRTTERQKALWKQQGRIEFDAWPGGPKIWQNYTYMEDKEKNWDRFDVLEKAKSFKGELLVVHGEVDMTTRLAEGEAIYNAARKNGTARLAVIKSGSHTLGTSFKIQQPPPRQVVEATETTLDFLERNEQE